MSVIKVDLSVLSLSKRKKKQKSQKSIDRSRMLKLVMPELSGVHGERLGRAMANNDRGAVASVMGEISKALQDKLKK